MWCMWNRVYVLMTAVSGTIVGSISAVGMAVGGGGGSLVGTGVGGMETAVVEYINQQLGHAFVAIPSTIALENGLYGPPPFVADTLAPIRDVIVIAKSGHVLLTEPEREKANKMIGRHGSLTVAEMVVPLLGYRLG